MALWLVSVKDVDWDEYDAVVVRAADEEGATRIAKDKFSAYQWNKHSVSPIAEEGPEEIILGSFNAG